MNSRLLSYLLAIVITLVLGYFATQHWSSSKEHAATPELISIEDAIKNIRYTTIRSDSEISIESCQAARKEILASGGADTMLVEGNEEIEKMLLSMLAQVENQASTRTHLSCLLHQLPVPRTRAGES